MAKSDEILAETAELKTEVAGLKTDIAAEKSQLDALLEVNSGVVVSLNARIEELEAIIAEGSEDPKLQEALDQLKATKEEVVTTRAEVKALVADAPEGGEGEGEEGGETGEEGAF